MAFTITKTSQHETASSLRLRIPNYPRVLCLSSAINSNISSIRLTTPLKEWSITSGAVITAKSIFETSDKDILENDIVVLQRDCPPNAIRLIKTAKKYNRIVIFEIDDLLIDIPDFLSHHRLSDDAKKRIEWVMQNADAISTSTERLATRLSAYNKRVFITPNYYAPLIDNINSTPPHPTADDKKTHLIIAASDTVTLDPIIPALQTITTEYRDLYAIHCIGPICKTLKSKNIPHTSVDIMPQKEFYTYLRSLPNPIGIIPLDNSEFSQCKSAVKYFDYSALQIPTICSQTPPYSDVILNGRTGILSPNETKHWVDAILKLRDQVTHQNVSKAGADHTRANFSIAQNTKAWSELLSLLTACIHEGSGKYHLGPMGMDIVRFKTSELRSFIKKINHKRLAARNRRKLASKLQTSKQ